MLLWVLCRGQACLLSMRAVTGSHVADCWCTSELRRAGIISATSPWIVTAGTVLHTSSTPPPLELRRDSLSICTWSTLKYTQTIPQAHLNACIRAHTDEHTRLLNKSSCPGWNMIYSAVRIRNTHENTPIAPPAASNNMATKIHHSMLWKMS